MTQIEDKERTRAIAAQIEELVCTAALETAKATGCSFTTFVNNFHPAIVNAPERKGQAGSQSSRQSSNQR